MARRKKENPEVHRNRIADSAGRLFLKNGIRNTSMDSIVEASGYSKATLYVYFKNKEELISYLTLKSMNQLKEMLCGALHSLTSYKERFVAAGFALYDYALKYPEYNWIMISTIRFGTDETNDTFVAQIFETGEQINGMLLDCIAQAKTDGAIKNREYGIDDVLCLWGMISGLIQIAQQKQEYLKLMCNKEPKVFLEEGLLKIYSQMEEKGD